jgi:chitinase
VDSANFAALRELKQRYPHLKILIAFGGWGGSKHFSDAALTADSRARFIRSTLDLFLRAHPGVFDGVDLDWEYPVRGGMPGNVARPEDRQNLTALVRELRTALDAEAGRAGQPYLITIATPAGAGHLVKYEMAELARVLDFINVMTYDFHSAGKSTHYNAPLSKAAGDPTPDYNVEASVAAYRAAGVPDHKLVVGVPFYGYGYGGVPMLDHGRFQPAQRNGFEDVAVAGPKPKWVGAIRFYDIANALKEGFQRHWDAAARVPWLYHPDTQIWITYDDAQSLGEKAEYVRREGLGGIMIWELSGDDGTLLPVINQELRR